MSGFCDRCVAAGISLDRAHVFIDTLHPVHEGRLFRWGYPDESPMHEYGRTSFEGLDATGAVSLDAQATDVWQRSPFYRMLETGASLLRRRLGPDTVDEFSLLPEWYAAGLTEYVAVLTRFAAEGVIGEMDALYSSWGTKAANSLDNQREASEAYIRSQAHEGWKLIRDRYDDGGFSGGSVDRPALAKLLGDVRARRVDVIVVYKVDRLTRSLAASPSSSSCSTNTTSRSSR